MQHRCEWEKGRAGGWGNGRAENWRVKILAAICYGPWLFISADVMRGRKATGVLAVRDDLNNAGAEYLDVPAVRDGNIITGRVPNDLPDFCAEIIAALEG